MELTVGLLELVRPLAVLVIMVLAGRAVRPEPWSCGLLEGVLFDLVTGMGVAVASVYALSSLGLPAMTVTLVLLVVLAVRGVFRSSMSPVDRATVVIVLGAVLTRLVPVADWHAPLFLDPVVEASLAARIMAVGGLPAHWMGLPELAVNHQPGFAVVAGLLAGDPVLLPKAILLLSALVQVMVPIAVMAVARRVWGQREAIVAGALAVAATFPAFTVTAGMNSANLAFLMALVAVAVLLEHRSSAWTVGGLLAIALVHPLGAVVVGLLLVPVRCWEGDLRGLLWDAGAAAVAGLAVLPYYWRGLRVSGDGASIVWASQAQLINPQRVLDGWAVIEPLYTFFYNPSGIWYQYLGSFPVTEVLFHRPVGNVMVLVAAAALVVMLDQRDRGDRVVLTWLVVFWALSWGQSALRLSFPGSQFLYPTRMKFFMVMPLCLMLARSIDLRAYMVRVREWDVPITVFVLAIAVPVSMLSIVQFQASLDTEQVVSDDDLAAIEWLRQEAGPDAVVLNEIQTMEAGTFVGDAGQWIPVYTGNEVVYPALSITEDVSAVQPRRELFQAIEQRDGDRFDRLADRYGVDHIFTSNGSMLIYDRLRRISRQDVIETCGCRPVFEQGGATVYEVSEDG